MVVSALRQLKVRAVGAVADLDGFAGNMLLSCSASWIWTRAMITDKRCREDMSMGWLRVRSFDAEMTISEGFDVEMYVWDSNFLKVMRCT